MKGEGKLAVILRHVDEDRWCVVVHRLAAGKREFVSRVATARPYFDACRVAKQHARAVRLHLGIEGAGERLRAFDPARANPSGGVA